MRIVGNTGTHLHAEVAAGCVGGDRHRHLDSVVVVVGDREAIMEQQVLVVAPA